MLFRERRKRSVGRLSLFRRPLGLAITFLLTALVVNGAPPERGSIEIYPSAQGRVESANGFIEIGYQRQTVLFVLGEPSSKLNKDLWVYRGFRCDTPDARGLDTLVLQFEHDALVAFKLVNERTLKAVVAHFNNRTEPRP